MKKIFFLVACVLTLATSCTSSTTTTAGNSNVDSVLVDSISDTLMVDSVAVVDSVQTDSAVVL